MLFGTNLVSNISTKALRILEDNQLFSCKSSFSACVDNLKKDNISCANFQYFDSVIALNVKYCVFQIIYYLII